MLSMLFWLAFGSMIGWIAVIMLGKGGVRATLALVVLGAAGGVGGGFLGGLVDASAVPRTGASGFMFAIFGAIAVVFIAQRVLERRTAP